MSTKQELEDKVVFMDKEISDLRGSVRALSQQLNEVLQSVNKTNVKVNEVYNDLVKKMRDQYSELQEVAKTSRY